MTETIDYVQKCIEGKRKSYIVAINTDVIVKMENDEELKRISDEANLTIVDGKPLIWISRLYKKPIKEKVSGSDLVPELCNLANKNKYSLFILGGKEGVAEKAKYNLEKKYNNINIVGTYSPPFGFEKNVQETEKINRIINERNPDILIVCFGCPKQEKWIYQNIDKYNATVSVCAGATVDFLAGNVKRAPKWISNIGLEWFYRFIKEPKRLFKRYFVDDIKIIKIVMKYRDN